MSSCVVICAECGKGYVARKRVVNGYCRECRKMKQREYVRRNREKARREAVDLYMAFRRQVEYLTVVNDLLGEDGGFRCGMRFSEEELALMWRYSSFTPGMTLKDQEGRLYVYGKMVGGVR